MSIHANTYVIEILDKGILVRDRGMIKMKFEETYTDSMKKSHVHTVTLVKIPCNRNKQSQNNNHG